ncbi:MAG: Rieske 2Fe-2S domain-containing protein [Chromatiales bacterium]|nr:MAG: Rieske 2Fe-2S domain-containing protein [Chromatiales bacterium]
MYADNRYSADALVRPDAVNARVYSDATLFRLEMHRIFTRSWNYVGHASQVPKPGDFFQTEVARRSVLMIRQEDGEICVLRNRCGHRGARIVTARHGHCGVLRCPYHGWTYHPDGRLKSIPLPDGYTGTELDVDASTERLPALRSANYRGFVFARLSRTGPAFEDWLGGARRALDNMVDRAPDGELEVAGGCLRAIQRNNWKVYLENLHDGMHPAVVHQSSIAASQPQQRKALAETGTVPLPVQIIQGNAQSLRQLGSLEVTCYPHGHSDMRGFREPRSDDAVFDSYQAALERGQGRDNALATLDLNIHNANFYPNFSVHPSFMQVRVLFPLSVNRTLIEHWTLRLKGAPDEFNRRHIVYANTVHSPSSLIKPDDLEMYHRVQVGVEEGSGLWISNHRRAEGEEDGSRSSTALSERFIRNQYRAWGQYMSAEDAG